jgi:energy-converting hydrogenase Eha subunit H
MRIKELFRPNMLIALTNEENQFLIKHQENNINLETLEPRESRIAENLLYKDILCKINNTQAMVNKYVSTQHKRTSK